MSPQARFSVALSLKFLIPAESNMKLEMVLLTHWVEIHQGHAPEVYTRGTGFVVQNRCTTKPVPLLQPAVACPCCNPLLHAHVATRCCISSVATRCCIPAGISPLLHALVVSRCCNPKVHLRCYIPLGTISWCIFPQSVTPGLDCRM